jgi:hypothetical protein
MESIGSEMRGKAGREGYGCVYNWAGMLLKFPTTVGHLGHGLVEGGGGGAMHGRRVRGALFWELAVGWKWRDGRAVLVQSRRHAGARQWGWWLNGQGSRGGCTSEVLGVSPARVREREGQGESMELRSGACTI